MGFEVHSPVAWARSWQEIRTFRWMFKTTVSNGSQQLWLQKEVSETSGVDTNIRAFLVSFLASRSIFGWSRRSLHGDFFRVRVVQQFFLAFVRHGDVWLFGVNIQKYCWFFPNWMVRCWRKSCETHARGAQLRNSPSKRLPVESWSLELLCIFSLWNHDRQKSC